MTVKASIYHQTEKIQQLWFCLGMKEKSDEKLFDLSFKLSHQNNSFHISFERKSNERTPYLYSNPFKRYEVCTSILWPSSLHSLQPTIVSDKNKRKEVKTYTAVESHSSLDISNNFLHCQNLLSNKSTHCGLSFSPKLDAGKEEKAIKRERK